MNGSYLAHSSRNVDTSVAAETKCESKNILGDKCVNGGITHNCISLIRKYSCYQGRTQDFILTEAKAGPYPEFQKNEKAPSDRAPKARVSSAEVLLSGRFQDLRHQIACTLLQTDHHCN